MTNTVNLETCEASAECWREPTHWVIYLGSFAYGCRTDGPTEYVCERHYQAERLLAADGGEL